MLSKCLRGGSRTTCAERCATTELPCFFALLGDSVAIGSFSLVDQVYASAPSFFTGTTKGGSLPGCWSPT
jgi:hypothetical protein